MQRSERRREGGSTLEGVALLMEKNFGSCAEIGVSLDIIKKREATPRLKHNQSTNKNKQHEKALLKDVSVAAGHGSQSCR